MIFGTFGSNEASRGAEDYLARWGLPVGDAAVEMVEAPGFRAGVVSTDRRIADRRLWTYRDPTTGVTLAGRGEIFGKRGLASSLGLSGELPLGRLLAEGYRRRGSSLFADLDGSFAIAACDPARGQGILARDHFGVEPLYFALGPEFGVHFSDTLDRLRAYVGGQAELNPTVVLRYLLLRYNPGFETIFRGIRKLRPGHTLAWEDGLAREKPYWHLSYRSPLRTSDADHSERLGELITSSVRLRLGTEGENAGAYLSGGMDSSSVVSVMGSLLAEPVHTYSFRCRGESFDESAYALSVSRKWHTEHHEVPFEAEDAVAIAELAGLQQEPLSDVGIEVASYILARQAEGVVDYVLTGDGGDELFAGHPVYLADRIARWYDRIPRPLRNLLSATLTRLPDRREKKSALVKAQRFAYSVDFPAELYSNRWRVSYKPFELGRLLHSDWRGALEAEDPLDPLRVIYAEADGPDFLSRTLYGDYFTVVDFYLRRMEILDGMGMSARFPLLDRRLVEYAARIPSESKVTSDSATKHLLKGAMSHLLPDEVLNRRDKLGNSVPLKNWLRDSPQLQEFVRDVLSAEAIRRRGILSPSYAERLWEGHLSGRENNSHRIWSLLVLELWLREHCDKKPPVMPPRARSALRAVGPASEA